MERRLPTSSFPNQLLYPAGAVDLSETNNVEVSLRRELAEELGVVPLDFARIPAENIYGETGKLLLPFHILKWEGQLPEVVLDKGNSLLWIEIATALTLPTQSMQLLTRKFMEYLQRAQK